MLGLNLMTPWYESFIELSRQVVVGLFDGTQRVFELMSASAEGAGGSAAEVVVSERQRQLLERLIRRSTAPQRLVQRARITPLPQYYAPSDFLTVVSISSLLHLSTDTSAPGRTARTSHVHLFTFATCRALRPRGGHLPSAHRKGGDGVF